MKKSDILALLEEVERAANTEGAKLVDHPSSARAPELESVSPVKPSMVSAPEPATAPLPSQPVEVPAKILPISAAVAERAKAQKEADVQRQDVEVRPDPVPAPQAAAAIEKEQTKPQEAAPPKPAYSGNWHDHVPTSHGGIVGRGLLFIFGFLAVFFAWSLLFPISSAVVASGKIVSTGQNKLVQHQVGGVVKKIHVKEGNAVAANDVILTLETSSTEAEFSRLLARQQTLNAQKLRYEAEQAGANAKFPDSALLKPLEKSGTNGVVAAAISTVESQKNAVVDQQRKEFEAGRKRLSAQLDTVTFQIETLKDQRAGLKARLLGARKLLQLTARDIGKIRPLANDGYLPKSRLWDAEKQQLEQKTEVENLVSQIDATEQRISESESKLAEVEQSDREKRSEELTKIIGELAELEKPIAAAKRGLELTELRAPVAGIITNLIANTEGGVVPAREPVAEIVPLNAQLRVEFRVPLNKSKYVFPGRPVRVTMTTFNRRTYDPIDGKVVYVSADSLLDTQTGEAYFLARAELTPDPEKETGIEEVSSGMASEVYVLSEPRVFASYVLQPLVDSFNRAFREI